MDLARIVLSEAKQRGRRVHACAESEAKGSKPNSQAVRTDWRLPEGKGVGGGGAGVKGSPVWWWVVIGPVGVTTW